MKITLKDIARQAEVSIMTVSRALRRDPKVAASTAHRIRKLAKSMGYRPDPALAALVAHRSRQRVRAHYDTLALVSNWPGRNDWLNHPAGRATLSGARKRALELGYRLEHFWLGDIDFSEKRGSEILYNRGIRGIIVAPTRQPDAPLSLNWSEFSVVCIEHNASLPNLHYVTPNFFEAVNTVWREATKLGYRRIGMAMYDDPVRVKGRWEAAHQYCQACLARDSDKVPTLFLRGLKDYHAGIADWIEAHRPDAILSKADDTILQSLASLGYSVPADIGYISLGAREPWISGLDQRRSTIGALAVDILNSKLQRNERGPDPDHIGTFVDGIWNPGETLRRLERPRSPRNLQAHKAPSTA